MKLMLSSWKTTIAGVGMILGAAADLCVQVSTWEFDMNRLQADGLAVIAGYGLIVAKDANK